MLFYHPSGTYGRLHVKCQLIEICSSKCRILSRKHQLTTFFQLRHPFPATFLVRKEIVWLPGLSTKSCTSEANSLNSCTQRRWLSVLHMQDLRERHRERGRERERARVTKFDSDLYLALVLLSWGRHGVEIMALKMWRLLKTLARSCTFPLCKKKK